MVWLMPRVSACYFDHVEFKFTGGNLTLSSTRRLTCIAQCWGGGLVFHLDRAAIQFMRKFAYLSFCLCALFIGGLPPYEWADIDRSAIFHNSLFILIIYFFMWLVVESDACDGFLRKS